MGFLEEYRKHVEERAKLGIPPLPLNAKQVEELVKLLQQVPIVEEEYLMDLKNLTGYYTCACCSDSWDYAWRI